MNNINNILQILNNAGFRDVVFDGQFISMEDPACIARSFETFTEYAWIGITVITGMLLFGWAISMIRGGTKTDTLITNIRNLILIFGTLSIAGPAINFIWGDDLFKNGCKTISVSMENIQKILGTRERVSISEGEGVSKNIEPTPSPSPSPSSVSATVSNSGVIYTMTDGSRIRRSGGSLAWRNNNPGNITCGAGLIFGSIACNVRFLIFPNESTGMRAITEQLKRPGYQNGTLGAAINRWAPPSENDTGSYQRMIERETGMSLSTHMSQLDDTALSRVAQVIRRVEGWKPGTEVRL
jgi:hypothetical protein